MGRPLTISAEGTFEVDGRPYRIPNDFSQREIFSYKRLLEPIPDIPGGTSLSKDQRSEQRSYFLRRAAACVVPGLQMSTLEEVPDRKICAIHRWISDHRPELGGALQEASVTL